MTIISLTRLTSPAFSPFYYPFCDCNDLGASERTGYQLRPFSVPTACMPEANTSPHPKSIFLPTDSVHTASQLYTDPVSHRLIDQIISFLLDDLIVVGHFSFA